MKNEFTRKAGIGAAVLGALALQGCTGAPIHPTASPLEDVYAGALRRQESCETILPLLQIIEENNKRTRGNTPFLHPTLTIAANTKFGFRYGSRNPLDHDVDAQFEDVINTYRAIGEFNRSHYACLYDNPKCRPPRMITLNDVRALCNRTAAVPSADIATAKP